MEIKKVVKFSLISLVLSQQLNAGANKKDDSVNLPSVIVKESKELENKKLPYSITFIDGEEIQSKGYYSLEELLRSTPGVSLNTSGGANVASPYIRGTGALYPLSMDDAFVVVNIDGAPISSRHLSLGSLDVESVEVLKGPQGTRSGGLGAIGAVNIKTNKPTSYTQGYFKSEVSSDGEHKVDMAVGGAITKSVSGRIAIQSSSYEYPIKNLQTNKPVSKPKEFGIRGSLNWNINSSTSALLSIEHQKSKHMGENIVLMPYHKNPKVDVTAGIYDYSHKTLDREVLQIEHIFNKSKLTSISSYYDAYNISPVFYGRLLNRVMTGNPNATEYWNDQESSDKVFSQDLRLSSLSKSSIPWVIGASFLDSNRTYNHSRAGTNSFFVYPGTSQFRDFDTRRYGIYGEATIPLSQRLKLIAGIRHTWEEKDYEATYTSSGINTYDDDSLSEDFTTGRIGLSYELSAQSNLYAMISRGYNPSGFQDYARKKGDAKYNAGRIYSFEMGIKSSFFDNKLSIDNSIFYTFVKDNYLIDSNGFNYFVVNADTKSFGYEISANWFINDNFNLMGNLSYINSKIKDDISASIRSGNDVPDVAKFSGNVSLLYHTSLPNLKIFDSSSELNTRIDYSYMGKRTADVQNNFDLDAYHKIDMHLGIVNGNKEIYLWGRNLLDKYYDLYGYYDKGSSVEYGSPAKGRSVGIGFTYTF